MGSKPTQVSHPVVLLVDDDADDQRLLGESFSRTRLPFDLRIVENGQSAIEYLLASNPGNSHRMTSRPSLLLTDVNMPVKSGWELLKWVRSQPDWAALIALVWTSLPNPEGAELARRLGATRYLAKPSDLNGYRDIAKIIYYIFAD